MASNLGLGFFIAVATFFLLMVIVLLIWWRYTKFSSDKIVYFFRNGKLINKGYGGGYFLLPFIDHLVVFDLSVQSLDVTVSEQLFSVQPTTAEVSSIAIYRINEHEITFKSIGDAKNGPMKKLGNLISDLVSSKLRTIIVTSSVEFLTANRGQMIDTLTDQVSSIVGPWGIELVTIEVKSIKIY